MERNGAWELSLSGEALNSFKYDFDNILQETLTTMLQKKSEAAAINMRIKISLTDDIAVDAERPSRDRPIMTPRFDHKIKSVLQIQSERTGFCGGDGYELAWDAELCKYTLRAIKSPQISIFDGGMDDEIEEEIEGEKEDAFENEGEADVVEIPMASEPIDAYAYGYEEKEEYDAD